MIEIAVLSVLAVASGLITVTRIVPFKALVRMHWASDLLFTLGLLAVLGGTLTGALTAAVAGLIFSLVISGARVCAKVKQTIATAAK